MAKTKKLSTGNKRGKIKKKHARNSKALKEKSRRIRDNLNQNFQDFMHQNFVRKDIKEDTSSIPDIKRRKGKKLPSELGDISDNISSILTRFKHV